MLNRNQPTSAPEPFSKPFLGRAVGAAAGLALFGLFLLAVILLQARLTVKNVEKLIQGQDLILDCTDNLETKYLLHDACFKFVCVTICEGAACAKLPGCSKSVGKLF